MFYHLDQINSFFFNFLRRDLSYNELNGSIPESLGELTSLQIL
jgi:hypothetical protein